MYKTSFFQKPIKELTMKSGYLFLLEHPSDPLLIKVGYTTGKLKNALERINTNFAKEAGQIVQGTGHKWRMKKKIRVDDPPYAKSVFWETSSQHVFRGNHDVTRMTLDEIELCLAEAKKAGTRPNPTPKRDKKWFTELIESTGLKMLGEYRGLLTRVEFEYEGKTFKEAPARIEAILKKRNT